jgi:hypothetical protein
MKTKIVMLETQAGSENGYDVKHYFKGKSYYVGDDLLENFFTMGICKIIEEYDDGFISPIDGYEVEKTVSYDNKAIEPQKRGRGRPPKR